MSAFVTQTKMAKMLGVAQSTLSEFFSRSSIVYKKQGVNSDSFNKAIMYYALESKNPTKKTLALYPEINL